MKRTILNAIIKELETELARLIGANEQSNRGATHSAPNAEKQRDTTGLEAAYLAHGYSIQCTTLAQQIEELKSLEVEDFTGQEIDVGAVVEVEMNGETDLYMLLHCGGGSEVTVDGRLVTVITPESPLGKALVGNIEAGAFSIAPAWKGLFWMYFDVGTLEGRTGFQPVCGGSALCAKTGWKHCPTLPNYQWE